MKIKRTIAIYAAKWAVTTAVVWYLKKKFDEKVTIHSSSNKTKIEVT